MGKEVSFVSLTKEQFNNLADPSVTDDIEMTFKDFIQSKDVLETIEDPAIGDVYIAINDGTVKNREIFVFIGDAWIPIQNFGSVKAGVEIEEVKEGQ